MAPAPAATTTPVNSRRAGVQPPGPCDNAKTSRQVANAPTAAAPSTAAAVHPARIASNAATDAPPDTPSTYGSASGLRSSACNNAPETASNPPTASADIARGRRSSRTTSLASDGSVPEMAAQTWPAVNGTLPDIIDQTKTPSAAAVSSANEISGGVRSLAGSIERIFAGRRPL